MTILIWTVVAVVSTGVVWKGSGWLERSSERLAVYYELPDIVKGAIVVAVGSSFPELSTTVISTLLHGEFELGVSAIVGSALFNILMVPALSGLAGEEQLEANRDLVYKEAQFYMIAVAVLLLTFSFAAIYNPVGPGESLIKGTLTRPLAMIPVALYVLYVFVQYQDTMDYDAGESTHDVDPLKNWGLLVVSLLVILAGVEGLVRAAINYGEFFGTPSFLWGITVVAAGTSIPDAFVSINAARDGKAVTSVANVLGSNIFDLLVCIPAGVLVAVEPPTINYTIAAPMMGVLTFATIVLFLMMRTSLILSRAEAWWLLAIYCVFVVWMGVETFGVVDLVHGLPPANPSGH
ncbi:MAG: sodium:calcium antiporter [Bradymonadaceae bacterium]